MRLRNFPTEIERHHARRIGARIAFERKRRGLAQHTLAIMLGITQKRISAVELGQTALSRRCIAEAVGIYDSEAFSDAPFTTEASDA